ncbi:hydrogenase-4 membrane subunit HyfE [Variovorax sp. GrIS 2.14]
MCRRRRLVGTVTLTLPLVLFLLAVVVPVFFGKVRSAPVWLALQAIALGWNGISQHAEVTAHVLVAFVEILVVRGAIAPRLLRRAIRLRPEPNLDLMPSNLFTWAIAIGLIVLAFEFGAPAMSDRQALTLGVVGATVAVALLVLSTNNSPTAQLVAVLLMENALALFESLLPEPWPLPVHFALSAIYLLTVAVGSWLVGARELVDEAAPAKEVP